MNRKIELYIATHNKELPEDSQWHIPIQVGAGLNEKFQTVCDNTGDNISYKNKNYCELTAMYWIWKNSKADIVGLEHYRRRFGLSENKIMEIFCEYDLIVPKEYKYRISLKDEYEKHHLVSDWNNMIEIVSKRMSLNDIDRVFDNNRLIPYNMFIMRKTDFSSYCNWLFPILDEIECLHSENCDCYQERYIGFIAERLFSLYINFMNMKVYYSHVYCKQTLVKCVKNLFGQKLVNPFIFAIKRSRRKKL